MLSPPLPFHVLAFGVTAVASVEDSILQFFKMCVLTCGLVTFHLFQEF